LTIARHHRHGGGAGDHPVRRLDPASGIHDHKGTSVALDELQALAFELPPRFAARRAV